MRVKATIKGAKDINRALKELGGTATGRVLRTSLRYATVQTMQKPAREELKSRKYHRRTYMKVVTRTRRNPNPKTVKVILTYLRDAFWLYFIEFGTKKHVVEKKDGSGGFLGYKDGGNWFSYGTKAEPRGVKAKPWLRPVYQQNRFKVIKVFGDRIWEEIRRQARRLNSGR